MDIEDIKKRYEIDPDVDYIHIATEDYKWLVDEAESLSNEKHILQQLWVTVNLSCSPPDDCNDPVILKGYMKACIKKADEYEALQEKE